MKGFLSGTFNTKAISPRCPKVLVTDTERKEAGNEILYFRVPQERHPFTCQDPIPEVLPTRRVGAYRTAGVC